MSLSWAWHPDKCLHSCGTPCHDRHLQADVVVPQFEEPDSVSSCSRLTHVVILPSVLVMARKEKLLFQEDEERGEQTHISPYSFS